MIKRVYWMEDKEELDFINKHYLLFSHYNKKYSKHELMQDYKTESIIRFLYGSNKYEETMPKSKNGDTHEILRKAFRENDHNLQIEQDKMWNCDGVFNGQERVEMVRHLKAKLFISEKVKLVAQDVIDAHRILMEGAIKTDGTKINAGMIPQTNCYSAGTDHVYPPPHILENGIYKILQRYNDKKQSNVNPVKVAADIFYDFVSLHPFEDGNGRVAQLLVSHALESTGTPFAVTIFTPHSRSRRHIIRAIRKKERNYYNKELFTIVASSLASLWQNFFIFIQEQEH